MNVLQMVTHWGQQLNNTVSNLPGRSLVETRESSLPASFILQQNQSEEKLLGSFPEIKTAYYGVESNPCHLGGTDGEVGCLPKKIF